jgi:hypothetical protein
MGDMILISLLAIGELVKKLGNEYHVPHLFAEAWGGRK